MMSNIGRLNSASLMIAVTCRGLLWWLAKPYASLSKKDRLLSSNLSPPLSFLLIRPNGSVSSMLALVMAKRAREWIPYGHRKSWIWTGSIHFEPLYLDSPSVGTISPPTLRVAGHLRLLSSGRPSSHVPLEQRESYSKVKGNDLG